MMVAAGSGAGQRGRRRVYAICPSWRSAAGVETLNVCSGHVPTHVLADDRIGGAGRPRVLVCLVPIVQRCRATTPRSCPSPPRGSAECPPLALVPSACPPQAQSTRRPTASRVRSGAGERALRAAATRSPRWWLLERSTDTPPGRCRSRKGDGPCPHAAPAGRVRGVRRSGKRGSGARRVRAVLQRSGRQAFRHAEQSPQRSTTGVSCSS